MNNKIIHTSLTAWLITAIVLGTGIFDIAAAFIRTNLSGVATGECGYGYGYEAWYGYSNWYGATCPTSGWGSVGWGGRYVPVPLPTPAGTKATTNTGSTKPTGTWSNPYGSNYVNWDDWLDGSSSSTGSSSNQWDSDIDVPTQTTNTNSAGSVPTHTVVTRRLPATGIN
jgi:hypothetical protein